MLLYLLNTSHIFLAVRREHARNSSSMSLIWLSGPRDFMNVTLCTFLRVEYCTHFSDEGNWGTADWTPVPGVSLLKIRAMGITQASWLPKGQCLGHVCDVRDPLQTVCELWEQLREASLRCIFLIFFYRLPSAVSQVDFIVVLLPLDLCPDVSDLCFPLASQNPYITGRAYFTNPTKTCGCHEDPERKQRNWGLPLCQDCIKKISAVTFVCTFGIFFLLG